MKKHILCSIDLAYTKEAAAILVEAEKQAGLDNAKLTVITVIPDYRSSWVGSFFKEGTLRKAALAASEQLRELVKTTLPAQENVKCIVEIGVVYEQVLNNIKKLKIDLVVLGAHKPNVIDRLIGPNASRIVRKSPASTLVIRLN
ncbi:universal stress protein [Psychromonas sp. SP041]|uniref:universal stress protein n=1 Tax=Psychromonas sp. SP041 TaxID=1365007 RepID=UPI0004007A18|nr:universal stress protein [Psychromonas sp. SP041]